MVVALALNIVAMEPAALTQGGRIARVTCRLTVHRPTTQVGLAAGCSNARRRLLVSGQPNRRCSDTAAKRSARRAIASVPSTS